MTENSLPPKQKKKASSVLCNYDTQCEVCGKEVGLSSYLPVHVSNHFHEQLKERFHSFAKNLKCRLCGLEESSSRALYRHLGVQHLKVNEILLEKGFRILPSSLTKKQDSKVIVNKQLFNNEAGLPTISKSHFSVKKVDNSLGKHPAVNDYGFLI